MALSESTLFFPTLLVIGIAFILSVWIYNGLVRLNRNIEKSIGNIDVLLKQRNDEIPKLVDTAQKYMEYEKEVLKQITRARATFKGANNPRQKAEADKTMKNALGNFFALAENYPDLKTTDQFQQIQERISDVEDQISDRREFYNESVTTYNTRINQIPYKIIAKLVGYQEREIFKPAEQRKDPKIDKQFGE